MSVGVSRDLTLSQGLNLAFEGNGFLLCALALAHIGLQPLFEFEDHKLALDCEALGLLGLFLELHFLGDIVGNEACNLRLHFLFRISTKHQA